jgi:hypothetical protein
MFVKEEMKFWAGFVAAVCTALMGAAVVPHPYDKLVMGLGAAAMAAATYMLTPPPSQK